MIRVGLTGGIGSGKSTVAGFFEDLGVPVYHADPRAKILMEHQPGLVQAIRELLGPGAYTDRTLNREYIASRVFSDPALLEELNALVHPEVRKDFEHWTSLQQSPYVLQEAAILFENGGHRGFDRMILVTAPQEERIRRVMQRDGTKREEVVRRMENQWPDEEKIPLADYVILNTDLQETARLVSDIHRELLDLSDARATSLC